MPSPFDPNSYGMPSFEDLMVGALTEEAARAKHEADQSAMAAQLRRQQAMTLRQHQSGMPVFDRGDALNVELNRGDAMAGWERGQNVPAWMLRGMDPYQAAEGMGMAMASRAAGGEPIFEPRRFAEPEVLGRHEGGTPELRFDNAEDENARQQKAEAVDDFVLRSGYSPGLFTGKTHAEAARLIADQLRARRQMQGDEMAAYGWGATDI